MKFFTVPLMVSLLAMVFSCNGGDNTFFCEVETTGVDNAINPFDYPASPDLSIDAYLKNDDYPLEIALYRDQKFFYNFKNDWRGQGTWSKKGGTFLLKSTKNIQNGKIELEYHLKQDPADCSGVIIEFSDRKGFQQYPLEIITHSV